MNDPMPPESLPPESSSFTSSIPPVVPVDENDTATTPPDRRKYDELIAVVIALLGMGSILFWVLGKNNPIAGKLPFGGAIAGDVSGGNSGAKLPDFTKSTAAADGASDQFSAGVSGDKPGLDLGLSTKSQGANNNRNRTAGLLAGGAAAGIAVGAGTADAQPQGDAPAPPTDAATTAPSPSTAAVTTPSVTPSTPASPTPEVVEPDVLPSATAPRKFSDVPATSPIAPYVDALSSRGVLDQFDDGTLNPDEPISRAEFAKLVSKAFGKPRIKPEIAFSDVPADYSGKAAVVEATRTGFMTGFPDGSFKPDLDIPRYQMQVAIVTGTQLQPGGDPVQALSKFADGSAVPKWALPKVATAAGAGILPAKELTNLLPQQAATRGEAVLMLHGALVKEGKLEAVK
ncbi:S-layer homology domain-containing protein [filamentous cyanobacterium LEGE 11480]|uniref:S-layer homology domain-containing protein n=1 Tax=Romeriopsis navalis LEGE 11480 TaxID=2777977 RepID=A0A928VR20_9CYAN|nr:S-layer homology domain-containing protein [Romeriopsis navalis]MBE9033178.1 S-layer homology domain-containing protein [Romeriopsis navalis LEGE 11480]